MQNLLNTIRNCDVCRDKLPYSANPVLSAHPSSKIVIVGQAPGLKVHNTGIPWNDPSGDQLRKWLDVSKEDFYDSKKYAIIPMGFCYPGKGKSGDMPPRPECAPLWHSKLLNNMKEVELTLLIGQYAQKYYLNDKRKGNLTETVRNYKVYLPKYLPLPHPSPRNRFWLSKNPWFEKEVIPELRKLIYNL